MGPGRNQPTMSRCPFCHLLYLPHELEEHKRNCLDNPDNEGNG